MVANAEPCISRVFIVLWLRLMSSYWLAGLILSVFWFGVGRFNRRMQQSSEEHQSRPESEAPKQRRCERRATSRIGSLSGGVNIARDFVPRGPVWHESVSMARWSNFEHVHPAFLRVSPAKNNITASREIQPLHFTPEPCTPMQTRLTGHKALQNHHKLHEGRGVKHAVTSATDML